MLVGAPGDLPQLDTVNRNDPGRLEVDIAARSASNTCRRGKKKKFSVSVMLAAANPGSQMWKDVLCEGSCSQHTKGWCAAQRPVAPFAERRRIASGHAECDSILSTEHL